jgi:hypothetical protein
LHYTQEIAMAMSTSYRLAPELKRLLAERAAREQISETALVTRFLEEGLKTSAYPGITYRDGPTGRRAALVAGPDVWEVVLAVRHAPGRGEAKLRDAAKQLGLPEGQIRLAVEFAAAYPQEIEDRIAMNDAAAERAREVAQQRARLLAS